MVVDRSFPFKFRYPGELPKSQPSVATVNEINTKIHIQSWGNLLLGATVIHFRDKCGSLAFALLANWETASYNSLHQHPMTKII